MSNWFIWRRKRIRKKTKMRNIRKITRYEPGWKKWKFNTKLDTSTNKYKNKKIGTDELGGKKRFKKKKPTKKGIKNRRRDGWTKI